MAAALIPFSERDIDSVTFILNLEVFVKEPDGTESCQPIEFISRVSNIKRDEP